MEFSNPVLVWACVGAVLMLAEVIVPGGIVILLGAACLIVAAALWAGMVDGLPQSFTLWFISAMVLLLAFRGVVQRLVGGDSHVANANEALDILNQQALVKVDIGPGDKPGRVEFQGSDWPALGDGNLIASGSIVRVICRENISLIVEPLSEK